MDVVDAFSIRLPPTLAEFHHDVRHLLRPQMLYMSSGEAVFFSRQEWQKISVDNDANHRDERSTAEAAWIFVPLRLTGDTG